MSPFSREVVRETLAFLETEFPVLSDPPPTTREAAVAVLCHRLRFVLVDGDQAEAAEDPFAFDPEDDEHWQVAWDGTDDGLQDPVTGEEWRPWGWTPFLWEDPEAPDFSETDASGQCFSDADPGL